REQQSWQGTTPDMNQSSYETGYGGSMPGMGWTGNEKLRPPRLPQPAAVWQWIILAVIVLAAASVLWWLINVILGSILFLLGVAVVFIAVSQLSVKKIT